MGFMGQKGECAYPRKLSGLVGGKEIAHLDRELTIITLDYYIGSNTFRLASPASFTCLSPI